MHIHVFSPIIHIKVCESKKKFVNQMFMTSNYLYIHYLTSISLGAAHISKFILTNNTCIYMYCNTQKYVNRKKKVCESNVYELKLLVHTLSHLNLVRGCSY